SSRRRHTRFSRDWSSDVCSSDLKHPAQRHEYDSDDDEDGNHHVKHLSSLVERVAHEQVALQAEHLSLTLGVGVIEAEQVQQAVKIGRASCRERVQSAAGAGA